MLTPIKGKVKVLSPQKEPAARVVPESAPPAFLCVELLIGSWL